MKFSTATLFLFLGSASAAREWTLDKPTLTVSCNLITVLIVDYVRMSSTIGFSVGYFCDLVPRKKERERSFFFSLLFVVSSIITYRAYVCCNCFASVLLSLSMDRVDPPEGWPRSESRYFTRRKICGPRSRGIGTRPKYPRQLWRGYRVRCYLPVSGSFVGIGMG